MDDIVKYQVLETYGTSRRLKYVFKLDKFNKGKSEVHIEKEKNFHFQSIKDFFVSVFLPYDYPHSVSNDYLQYQIWDTIQAFASSINGGICTHAVLKGMGVGDENASPVAATITWLLKDGASMVGRILFAWLQGTKLDSDCKKWRLFADVVNDITLLLDLISGYFQQHFLLIVCLSGVMKSLVGVAGGCTRAALTQHQARKNNMADVSAKDGSQETLVNLAALICSLVLIPIVTKSFVLTWILFLSMIILHLVANYFAVKSVMMETFNEARFKIFCNDYFNNKQFLSVKDVNQRENVFFLHMSENISIKLGSSFTNITQYLSYHEIQELFNIYKNCKYLICASQVQFSKIDIVIVFSPSSTIHSEFEAFYEACYLKCLLEEYCQKNGTHTISERKLFYEKQARNYTTKTFDKFMTALKSSKFNTEAAFFNVDLWRAKWE